MTPLDTLKQVHPKKTSPVQPHRGRLWKRCLLAMCIVVSIFILLGATSERFTDVLAIPVTDNQPLEQSDVIIVLGAGTRNTESHLPPQAEARVAEGVQMLRDGWAPHMIVSGGFDKNTGLTEATFMAQAAIADGAPAASVIQESQSKNTWENATDSLAIMKEHGWNTALVVSSPYHTWRACMIFKKQQAMVHCIAAPMRTNASHTTYERLMDFRSVVREYGAIVYFFFKHYI